MTTQQHEPPSRALEFVGRRLGAAPAPAPASQRPETPEDAERRFWRRYGPDLLAMLLGGAVEQPKTVDDWLALAEAVRDVLRARAAARAQLRQ